MEQCRCESNTVLSAGPAGRSSLPRLAVPQACTGPRNWVPSLLQLTLDPAVMRGLVNRNMWHDSNEIGVLDLIQSHRISRRGQ